MKISSIPSYQQHFVSNNYRQVCPSKIQNVSFGIYGAPVLTPYTSNASPEWSRGLIDKYGAENGIRALAEYFHDMDDSEIRNVCNEAYFFEATKQEKARELINVAHVIQREKEQKLNEIARLTAKAALGESNIATQKANLQADFINYLDMDEYNFSKMNEYPIPNGIILYGPSTEKENFVQWIEDSVPKDKTVVKHFTFNTKSPQQAFAELVDTVEENNDLYYNTGNKRIILLVDSLTPLLKPVNEELYETQAGFKAFMEECAKKYHTTIITTIDSSDLKEFESSAIGYQRFSRYKLKDGITAQEKETLKKLKAEIERLNTKSTQAFNKFSKIPWYKI